MKITSRLALPEDLPQFAHWAAHTPLNLFDPRIAQYPQLRTAVIEGDGEPLVYAPFHPIMIVESLAHRPHITARENAMALRKLQDELEDICRAYGIAEIWWMCADESLIDFSCRHGYERIQTAVLRKRVENCTSQT